MRWPTLIHTPAIAAVLAVFFCILAVAEAVKSTPLRLVSRLVSDAALPDGGQASIQHWQPPSERGGLDFGAAAVRKVSTVFKSSSNPFAYQAPTPAAKGNNRIVGGVSNALGPGQDPSPFSRIEGDGQRHYYFPTIDFGYGVYMQTSTDLNTVLSVATNEYSIFNYTSQIGTEAPGLFKWDDNNYLMYISSVGPAGNGYLYVLHNDGRDLLSGWTDLGPVTYADGAPMANYDGFPFLHPNGKRYLLFSGLHSVRMSQLYTYTRIGKRATETIIAADENTVVEAPGAVVRGKTLNIFWSEDFLPNYNTIVAAISTSKNPAKANWKKARRTTILQSNSQTGVYGPGSSAVFDGPDGTPWIAYTCFYNANGFDQTKENPRRVHAQPLAFSGNRMAPMTPDAPVRYNP